MKRLILLIAVLALVAAQSFAQGGQSYIVQPVVSTTTISTIVTKAGKDTIYSAAKAFGNVVVGQQVYGPGLPFYCTVKALPNPALDSAIVLSDTCSASSTVSLQFGYFTSAAYQAGDWLGLPFRIRTTPSGGVSLLTSVIVVDSSDVLDAFDIVYLKSGSGSMGFDNATLAVPVADAGGIVGYTQFTTITDLGSVRISQDNDTRLTMPRGGYLYARLIARSAMTMKSTASLFCRFRFIQ
jgi:hypothetical protein